MDAADRAALEPVADAHVGADAGSDVLEPAFPELGDQVRIGDVRPRHAHHVGFAAGENSFRLNRIGDAPDREYRKLDGGTDAGREVHEQAVPGGGRGPVLRAQEPVHVGAGDDVEIVHFSVALDHAGDGLHLLELEPAFDQLVAWNAKAHDAVAPHAVAHRRDHLAAEPRPVLDVAPVGIGAPIGERRQERRDEEPERSQDLDPIHPSPAATLRGSAECGDDLRNLVDAHRVRALAAPHQLAGHRRGRPHRRAGLGGMGGRGAVAELGEDDAAFLVDGAGEHAIAVDDGVVDVGQRAARSQSPGVMDGSAAGDLKPGAAARPRPMVGGVACTGDAAVTEPDLVRGDQDAAPKALRSDLDWREQMRKAGVRCGA